MSGFRGGRTHSEQAPSRLKGLFERGVWKCDCDPRLPAVRFQVKKAGPTKGRWFYSCQKQQDDKDRCKFFLWQDDAQPREHEALMTTTSRTEPAQTTFNTPSRPRSVPSPPSAYTPQHVPQQSRKRSRAIKEEDDEFAFDGDDDPDFANELSQVLEEAETPSKAARTENCTTPARRTLPWANKTGSTHGLHTPQTGRRDPFSTRFAEPGASILAPSKSKEHEDDMHQTFTPASSPFDTPTPSRFKHVGGIGVEDDLVRDVFGLLHESNVKLSGQTENSLRGLLTRHVRKAEGFRRGQHSFKLSMNTKEAKIAELEYRISMLESGLDTEYAQFSES